MFIPATKPINQPALKEFVRAIGNIDRLVVLTGAGISTESGIPDYRSENVGVYARTNHRPMTHQQFMSSHKNRQRYWARNFLAWPRFSQALPNKTHYSLASWERSERFQWLITQNVDSLHSKAGSENLTELHGSGYRVRCTECKEVITREDLQERLSVLNPEWLTDASPGEIAPDGDVQIAAGAEEGFNLVGCEECGGILKTDVVFFGDNVPRTVVDDCYDKIDSSDGLLVLGSSLAVMSGYRFAYHASIQQKPLFIVNIGPTRADHLATLKLEAKCSEIVGEI